MTERGRARPAAWTFLLLGRFQSRWVFPLFLVGEIKKQKQTSKQNIQTNKAFKQSNYENEKDD
jgi:hypothetical protein